ncbi:hypothetical protein [Granulosicoccus antarcticus]|uniref:Lipoprotein n=1 Tax=Granulosicoccus antarcticus IMCC3135 TaxID=1192854 RepID=A0A2Z2P097_9GAMM|nr:hypothetical protein [Granulosicoccus antarcticus]ASJ76175.1 hypothetical protein IMCC3135_30630 [Granulosicoccus antarcticus IMCC3135]
MIARISKIVVSALLVGGLLGCSSSSSEPADTTNPLNPTENEAESTTETGDVTSGLSWTVDGVAFTGDVERSQQIALTEYLSTSNSTTGFNFGSNVDVGSVINIAANESGAGDYTLVGSLQELIEALRNSPGSPVAHIAVVVDSIDGGNATWNSATGTVSATIVGDDVYHYSTSEPLTFTLDALPGSDTSGTPLQVQVTLNDVFGTVVSNQ